MNERKSVLIVDDDTLIMKIYKAVLEQAGYEVTTLLYTGQELGLAEQNFDIAVIDGLHRKCFPLYSLIKAKHKIVYSPDEDIVRGAQERGWQASPPGDLRKIIANTIAQGR